MATTEQLVVYPVKDLEKAKELFTQLLGSDPYVDSPYYVGYRTRVARSDSIRMAPAMVPSPTGEQRTSLPESMSSVLPGGRSPATRRMSVGDCSWRSWPTAMETPLG